MRYRRVAALSLVLAAVVFAGKKKNPDDITQTLEVPKDPPMVAIGDASRLVFHVSPLSAKGLLTQQTRDAVKAILKLNSGAPVVHVRAFVAGNGDMRRVPQIVSEVLTEKKMPLPSISVIQVGALPLEGAQVALETVSEAKRTVNPEGLTFVTDQGPESMDLALSATCFVRDGFAALARPVAGRIPGGAVDYVQLQRAPLGGETRCEGAVKGGRAAKLAFTGTQVAFGTNEKAARTAFERLNRELGQGDVIMSHIYALSPAIGGMARMLCPWKMPPVSLPVEGVAAIDGAFAVDAIAALR